MKEKYNLTNVTEWDLNQFVEAAHNVIQTRKQKDWTFNNGCEFAFAALTTIGYGEITPKTALGQGLTIPYCLVGLPLTMLALKTSGEVILLALRSAMCNFEKKVLGRQNPRIGFVKLFWTIIICQALIICMFALLETYIDGWTFLEGVYCWFITFTTIGFGDYVPFSKFLKRANYDEWLIQLVGWFVTFPYIVGLVLVASLLNLLVESSENIKMRCATLRNCCVCTCIASNGIDAGDDENGGIKIISMETNAKCSNNGGTNTIDQENANELVISNDMNQKNHNGDVNTSKGISNGVEN
ncbi:potassium channel subfamily K member 3-like isoform X2 [Exaiptasia diaphana]|nr:potassium channel subfamily K member 3-like isoform X2 [Exaiptasia diaphana]